MHTDKQPEEENGCYCSKAVYTTAEETEWAFPQLYASGNTYGQWWPNLLINNVLLSVLCRLTHPNWPWLKCCCILQDAHEFLNFLLNELVDILEKECKAAKELAQNSSSNKNLNGPINNGQANGSRKEPDTTWVHKCFQVSSHPSMSIFLCLHSWSCCNLGHEPVTALFLQGILTNQTKCLRCETVTDRDETFLDLSLDIEQNSSITSCLKNFSSTETLNAEDKFFCDKCCR
jgi:hypothetical protein